VKTAAVDSETQGQVVHSRSSEVPEGFRNRDRAILSRRETDKRATKRIPTDV
jgi:hypothetical protein